MHAVGYCVGGTMLAVALAAMAARNDERIVSATLFAAQVDFTYAGDLKVFVDEEQLEAVEQRMAERGYLEGKSMVTVFNLLRSNDLIWPYVINNYLKGKAPFPFDLLYWNSDATRLPAANHSFYLRNCYLDNKLTKGEMTIGNTPIDLKAIKIPVYNLATREDHIAPAKSVLLGCKFFGGPVQLRAVRLRPHRRRGQSAGQAQISVLDRPEAAQRQSRRLARQGERASGLVVARLARLAQSVRTTTEVARAHPRRRRAQADRGRAGQLREGAGLRRSRYACVRIGDQSASTISFAGLQARRSSRRKAQAVRNERTPAPARWRRPAPSSLGR